MERRCPECNNQIVGYETTCYKCGAKLPNEEPMDTKPRKSKTLGILSLIMGCFGFVLSFIYIGIVPALAGYILAIIAFTKKRYAKTLALIGMIISVIATACFIGVVITDFNNSSSEDSPEPTISATGEKETTIESTEKHDNITKPTEKPTEKQTEKQTEKETQKTAEQMESELNELLVEYIAYGSSQYEDGTHTIIFSFLDSSKKETWMNCEVDLAIVNDNGETVYSKEHKITKTDYSTWSGYLYGEHYAASIILNDNEITKGSCEDGKIILNVTGARYGLKMFEDYEISINDLPHFSPTDSCSIELPTLPMIFNEYNWDDTIDSTVRIDDISVEWEENYDETVNLIITLTGEKTYGENGYCHISYKLYDSEGYVVDSGNLLSDKMSTGDKFRNWEESFYFLSPDSYKLELYEYN